MSIYCQWNQLLQVIQLAKPEQLQGCSKRSSLPLASSAALQVLMQVLEILASYTILLVHTHTQIITLTGTQSQNQLLEVSQSWIAVLTAISFFDSHCSEYLTFGKAIIVIIFVGPYAILKIKTNGSKIYIRWYQCIQSMHTRLKQPYLIGNSCNEEKYSLFYLSKLSFSPSHGLTKSSFSKTNPDIKISTPSLCNQKFVNNLIWNNKPSAKILWYHNKGDTKFIHENIETQIIVQPRKVMSQENRNIRDIKTYALVMVFSDGYEIKLINTPYSPSHFASRKSSTSSW